MKLSDPFLDVHWRVGSVSKAYNKEEFRGQALAYLDARDIMDRLDAVVGPSNWQVRYPFVGCCEIGIWSKDKSDWIWKANGADETQYQGVKGQFSDSMKRAAVLWGMGRYLYGLKNIWMPVTVDKNGKNAKFEKETIAILDKKYEDWIAKNYKGETK